MGPTALSSLHQQLPSLLKVTAGTCSMPEPTEEWDLSRIPQKALSLDRGKGQSNVHRKKEKAFSHHSSRWAGIGSTILEVAHHSQPEVKIIPTTLLAIRKTNKQQPVKPVFELNLIIHRKSSHFPQSNCPQSISTFSQAFLLIASSSLPNVPTTSPGFTVNFAHD